MAMQYSEELSQRIGDCRELYLKYGGKRHELIEKEMRALGHSDFYRRILYRRFERGTMQPGWIETYGWDWLLKEQQEKLRNADCGMRIEEASGVTRTGGNASVNERAVAEDSIWNKEDNEPPTTPQSAIRDPRSNDFDEFKEWLKQVSPDMQWEFKHQVYIYKKLKRLTDGDIKRLMIFMPPRHGKSEMVTVRYAAWRLKQNPAMNVIIASYNQQLANRFSRKIKGVLCDDHAKELRIAECGLRNEETSDATPTGGNATIKERALSDKASRNEKDTQTQTNPKSAIRNPQSVFPFVRSRPKNTEAEWETTMGGGLRAVGVGSGVTGFGADLIVIDDPVKSRAEAESKTCRERLWNWFKDDISTRLEPNGAMILIQTRWHEDDLAGRLLRESQEEGGEQWTVVNLPALAELRNADRGMRIEEETKSNEGHTGRNASINERADTENVMQNEKDDQPLTNPRSATRDPHSTDPLGRTPGQSLWPERFPEHLLDKLKRQMGSYSFASLYQQRPTPAEGGLFKRAWFKIINSPPPNLKWTRGYDLGISKSATADYTASVRVAFDDNQNMYIDGGYRARIEYPEQRRYILGRIAAERGTVHGIELSANGNAVIQDLRKSRLTLGRALRGIQAKGDKVTNALSWVALAEEGHVHLVRGPWNKDFIEEAAAFPLGTHDDQIDAVSLAVRLHRERGYRSYGF